MTNEELMQLMTDMGRHEGGIENWVHDNAWLLVVNKAIAHERAACAKVCEEGWKDGIGAKYQGDVFAEAIRARGEE